MIFLFDLDGTLIDSTPAILGAMGAALKDEGLNASDEFIKSKIGAPLKEMMSAFGCKDNAQMQRLLANYKAHYGENYLEQTKLIDSAKEALELAASVGVAAIVTTKTGFYSRKICEHFGLSKYLSALIGGDEVCGQTKPAAAPIYAALSDIANNINSAQICELTQKRALCQIPWWDTPNAQNAKFFSQAVMIGDTLNDTFAAAAAGIRAYVTLFEYTSKSAFMDQSVSILSSPLECVQTAIKDQK